jgi:hypothetical protein
LSPISRRPHQPRFGGACSSPPLLEMTGVDGGLGAGGEVNDTGSRTVEPRRGGSVSSAGAGGSGTISRGTSDATETGEGLGGAGSGAAVT